MYLYWLLPRLIQSKLAVTVSGYEQLSVACVMERIAYSLCYVGALGFRARGS